jgi:ribosomal protein S18 acetylase RimI-like enzyme
VGATIRAYRDEDETPWVRCRALAFLDTAFWDSHYREKEHYERPSIELVADAGGQIVGFIDVECEEEPGTLCYPRPGLAGMIWHVGVHPDHRGQGIGGDLVRRAQNLARERGIVRFEAWTRDDDWVQRWYEGLGFEQIDSYLHVYVKRSEREGVMEDVDGLRPVNLYAHYVGSDRDSIRARFERVHDCVLYELRFA